MKGLLLSSIVAIMGNVFIKACWNETAGRLINPAENLKSGDRDLLMDPEVQDRHGLHEYTDSIAKQRSAFADLTYEGNVESRVVPAYEITYPEEYIRTIKDARLIVHSYVTTMQQLKEEYADHPNIEDVQPGLDEYGYQIWFAEKVQNLGTGSGSNVGGGSNSEDAHGRMLDS
ncbi:MAG: hypothetical protein JRD03_08260, partial [Deltaproteobacteria bacterium]|nr:hypothetical protein [Deltaproteobacteria bacterium]